MRFLLGLLALAILAPVGFAADQLIIISPHRKSIEQEFIPEFKKHYKETYKTDVDVQWLDQGGTSTDVRFVKAKFSKNPKTSGIDIFWGGGADTFVELNNDKILAKYDLPKALAAEIPQYAAGVAMYDQSKTWYASANSSFGIFYNKKVLKFEGIEAPKTWEDLAAPKYFGNLTVTDPRHSGSAKTMNIVMLQALGWEKGWQAVAAIHANSNKISHSSSDPIKAVVSGDVAACPAIDFYANAKIGDLGPENLGFRLPEGKTVMNPDPVAILKGAPNRKTAERFVNYILSADAQKILILPKGSVGGPKFAALGRMAVNTKAYEETEGRRTSDENPFKMKGFLKLDVVKSAKMGRILNDLVGATLVDTHKELKAAWKILIKRGYKPDEIAAVAKPPVTEAELLAMVDKWNDNIYRNKMINEWVNQAKAQYEKFTLSH